MSNTITGQVIGTITEVHTVRHTYYGNPIKSVSVDFGSYRETYETLPNAQLGFYVGNFIGQTVMVGFKSYRGSNRIESVEAI